MPDRCDQIGVVADDNSLVKGTFIGIDEKACSKINVRALFLGFQNRDSSAWLAFLSKLRRTRRVG